ncbi:MAG: class I SAM-dependent methyltransferase [Candidatus Binatia bacterium]
MEAYRRKTLYQDKAVAESYLGERFSSPKGRRENEQTRIALEQAFDKIAGVKNVLDVPCGNGRFSHLFRGKGYRYVGADVSMEMLQVLAGGEGSRESGKFSLVRCDGENLPFKDDAFDCVACIRFLNLVPAAVRRKILSEIRRVSKRWLIVQSHHLKSMGPLMRLKLMAKRILGSDLRKYELQKDILGAGWIAGARVRIKGTRQCVGVYQKAEGVGAAL